MKKILFILTGHSKLGETGKKTGYYLSEVTHPYYELINKDIRIEFATINGGIAPMDPDSNDLTDELNLMFVNDNELFTKLSNTLSIENLNPKNYDAVFFPGGHGAVFDLPSSKICNQFVANVYENHGVVAAVCHGPAGLLNVKLSDGSFLVKNKKINSFTNEEESAINLEDVVPFLLESELVKRGAIFEKSGIQEKKVVVYERVITGQNPASAKEVGKEIAKLLG